MIIDHRRLITETEQNLSFCKYLMEYIINVIYEMTNFTRNLLLNYINIVYGQNMSLIWIMNSHNLL